MKRLALLSYAVLFTIFSSTVSAKGLGPLYLFGKGSVAAAKNRGTTADSSAFDVRDPRALSVTQLARCLRVQQQLRSLDLTIKAQEDFLISKERALSYSEQSLKPLRDDIDRLAAESVRDSYLVQLHNEKVEKYNQMLAAHNVVLNEYRSGRLAYESKFSEYQSNRSTFNGECADRPYYESDMSAAQALVRREVSR